MYGPLSRESSAVTNWRAVCGLRLEASLGGVKPGPLCLTYLAEQNRRSFPIRNRRYRKWRYTFVPSRDLQTQATYARPSNAGGGEDSTRENAHTSMEVLALPALCGARTRGGGWCCVRKIRFVFCGQRAEMITADDTAHALPGDEGKTCFGFRIPT